MKPRRKSAPITVRKADGSVSVVPAREFKRKRQTIKRQEVRQKERHVRAAINTHLRKGTEVTIPVFHEDWLWRITAVSGSDVQVSTEIFSMPYSQVVPVEEVQEANTKVIV